MKKQMQCWKLCLCSVNINSLTLLKLGKIHFRNHMFLFRNDNLIVAKPGTCVTAIHALLQFAQICFSPIRVPGVLLPQLDMHFPV